jgi:hypothetical protein
MLAQGFSHESGSQPRRLALRGFATGFSAPPPEAMRA